MSRRSAMALVLAFVLWQSPAMARVGIDVETLPGLAAPVRGAFVGSHGDVFFVAGGQQGGQLSSTVAILTADASSWVIATLAAPVARGAAASTQAGLICAGGIDASGPSGHVFRLHWDGRSLQQTTLPDLPTPRVDASAVVLDGVLYIIGGRAGVTAPYPSTVPVHAAGCRLLTPPWICVRGWLW
ncbi:MAG: hypothetical protein O2782_02670 [bacterium]|nr:hypothetical protein [bacterium]